MHMGVCNCFVLGCFYYNLIVSSQLVNPRVHQIQYFFSDKIMPDEYPMLFVTDTHTICLKTGATRMQWNIFWHLK